MKKILMTVDYNLNETGGAQYSSLLTINGLSCLYDFKVVMPGKKKYKEINSLNLEQYSVFPSVYRSPINFMKTLSKLKQSIDSVEYDIYHSQMVASFLAILSLKTLKLIKKRPLIFTDRSLYEDHSFITKCIIKLLYKNIDSIVVTSDYNYKKWNSYIGNKIPIKLIYNSTFSSFEQKKIELENNSSVKVIGFGGRFTVIKGWDLVEEICKSLANRRDIKFIFAVGVTQPEDYKSANDMLNRLDSYIPRERLELKFDVPISEMPMFFEQCDLFISTSSKESFGRVAVEAMSQNTCVYGRRVGGLQEVIGDENFLYSDINELIPKVEKLLNNKLELEYWKNHFYKRYYENYSIDKNIDAYKTLYESLM